MQNKASYQLPVTNNPIGFEELVLSKNPSSLRKPVKHKQVMCEWNGCPMTGAQ